MKRYKAWILAGVLVVGVAALIASNADTIWFHVRYERVEYPPGITPGELALTWWPRGWLDWLAEENPGFTKRDIERKYNAVIYQHRPLYQRRGFFSSGAQFVVPPTKCFACARGMHKICCRSMRYIDVHQRDVATYRCSCEDPLHEDSP